MLEASSGSEESRLATFSVAVKGLAAAPLASRVVELNQQAATDYSGALVALLTALPFGMAAIVMLVMAKHSAATGKPSPLHSSTYCTVMFVAIMYIVHRSLRCAFCASEDSTLAIANLAMTGLYSCMSGTEGGRIACS